MLGKVRCDGRHQESGSADPVFDQVGVHPDVGGDFAVPVSDDLKFVETILESVFIVRT